MPVPDFSPGEVLTAAAMDSIGLWLVKTQTIGSTVASVTVADAFSADYNSYVIRITEGVGSTSAVLNFAFSGSATGYYRSASGFRYDNVGVLQAGTANATSLGAGFMTVGGLSFDLNVFNPNVAARSMFTGAYAEMRTVAGSGAVAIQGFHDVATAYTGFTITPGAGTLTGGTVRVYGYRN